MPHISPRNPESVDWRILTKRVYWAALRLVGHTNRVVDCGISSAEDLVAEAMTEFFDSPNGLSWDGTEDGLVRLLCGVLRNKFLDHLRRDGKVHPDSEGAMAGLVSKEAAPDDQAACKVVEARLIEAVRGHPKERELEDFIVAASCITETGMVDKQMADLLDISVNEVRNRRKMLLRIASIQQIGISLVGRTA